MKNRVQLVFDADCPNVGKARRALREAFARAGLEPEWEEIERSGASTPVPLRRYGSPTILVDGLDVGGEGGDAAAPACRVYPCTDGGFAGAPAVERVAEAIRSASDPAKRRS